MSGLSGRSMSCFCQRKTADPQLQITSEAPLARFLDFWQHNKRAARYSAAQTKGYRRAPWRLQMSVSHRQRRGRCYLNDARRCCSSLLASDVLS